MFAYTVRRALSGLVMLVVLTFVTYVVFFQIPANPGRYLTGLVATNAQLAAADRKLGLNHPWWVQYVRYLGGLLHGQMGTSYASQEPVSSIIRAALPITASVVVGGAVVMLAAFNVVARQGFPSSPPPRRLKPADRRLVGARRPPNRVRAGRAADGEVYRRGRSRRPVVCSIAWYLSTLKGGVCPPPTVSRGKFVCARPRARSRFVRRFVEAFRECGPPRWCL